MATIVALTSNNWSSTTSDDPWPGGTKPSSGDTVQTDEYVIEIDEDVSVALLESTSSGYFSVSAISGGGTRTITADVLNNNSVDSVAALLITAPTGNVAWTGNATGGNMLSSAGVNNQGTISALTGNATGGSNEEAYGVANAGTITTWNGDLTGGSAAKAYGLINEGTITTFTGDITVGSIEEAHGLWNADAGTITALNSDVTGGSVLYTYPVYNRGTITAWNGNLTGGSDSREAGALFGKGGSISINGNVTGGSDACAIYNQGASIDIDGLQACGEFGVTPVAGAMRLVAAATNAMTFLDTSDAELTLSNDYPAVADVKDGVVYKLGTLEGELATGGISHVTVVIGGNVTRLT
jgi:hypothetical protein